MNEKTVTRRSVLQSASSTPILFVAGCVDGDDKQNATETELPDPTEEGTSATETQRDQRESVFDAVKLDGAELVITLSEPAVDTVAEICVDNLSDEICVAVRDGRTEYRFDATTGRPGPWEVQAVDTAGNTIESVEIKV